MPIDWNAPSHLSNLAASVTSSAEYHLQALPENLSSFHRESWTSLAQFVESGTLKELVWQFVLMLQAIEGTVGAHSSFLPFSFQINSVY